MNALTIPGKQELMQATSLLPVLDKLDAAADRADDAEGVQAVLEGYVMVEAVASERRLREQANRAEGGVTRQRTKLGALQVDERKDNVPSSGRGGDRNVPKKEQSYSASERKERSLNNRLAEIGDERVAEVVIDLVDAGERPTPAKVVKVARDKERHDAKTARLEERERRAVESLPEDGQVFECRCRNLVSWVDAGSLDAIFTDPPYTAATMDAYDELARFALHGLAPGGLLIAETQQHLLPETYAKLGVDGLVYRWTLALVFPPPVTKARFANIDSAWRPLVVYERAGETDRGPFKRDTFTAPPYDPDEKKTHPWEKAAAKYAEIASTWLRPGWRVADPFCGTGGLMRAAKDIGCTVIGCDIDPAHVATARSNLR